MQKIIMSATSAMTMLRSREDQRVQKDCRWSVPRAQSCDKSDKTPDVKMEKTTNVTKHQMSKLRKNEQSKTQLHAITLTI